MTPSHLRAALLSVTFLCLGMQPELARAQQARLEVYADRIAQCYIERAPEQARRWLGTLPGTREEGTVYRRSFGFEVCAEIVNIGDVWMTSMDRQRQRDLVAAAVLRTDYPSFPDALPPQTPTGTWLNRQIAALTPQAQVDRTAVQMLMFGDCLARRQWPAVARLLRSERDRTWSARRSASFARISRAAFPRALRCGSIPRSFRTVVTEPVYHILLDTPADLSPGSTGR